MGDLIKYYGTKEKKKLFTITTGLKKEDLIIIYYMIKCSENFEPCYGHFSRIDLLENMRLNFDEYEEDLRFLLENGNTLLNDILITDFKSLYKEFFENKGE